MTGYASNHLQSTQFSVDLSLKCVNGRFFEFRAHLPKSYAHMEAEIKKIVNSGIKRGTVDLYIFRRQTSQSTNYQVITRVELARQWLKSYREMAKQLGLKADIDLKDVVQNPDMIEVSEKQEISKKEEQAFYRQLKKLISQCNKERSREGQALKNELKRILKEIESMAEKMKSLVPLMQAEIEARHKKKIEKLGLLDMASDSRFIQEMASQVDKSDVTEELMRLKEHLLGCRKLMEQKAAQGKKLDFYCQELLREVNTVGSKVQMAKITSIVVEAKTLIEQLREQVQNIE